MRLMLHRAVSSRGAAVGDAVEFQVLEDVKAGGLIMIAKKQVAIGRITSLTASRRGQRAAQIEFTADQVSTVDGQNVPLRAHFRIAADNRHLAETTGKVAGTLLNSTRGLALPFLPLFMLKHGDEVDLLPGLTLTAFSSADITAFRDEIEYRLRSAPPDEISHQLPKITIYQLQDGEDVAVRLFCGKGEIGTLRNRQKVVFSLPPGTYWFRTDPGEKPQQLKLSENQHYFLRSVMLPVGFASQLKRSLLPVEEMVGEIQTMVTDDVDAKHLMYLSQIQPDLLTADLSEKKHK